jgi:hypothetical protein
MQLIAHACARIRQLQRTDCALREKVESNFAFRAKFWRRTDLGLSLHLSMLFVSRVAPQWQQRRGFERMGGAQEEEMMRSARLRDPNDRVFG